MNESLRKQFANLCRGFSPQKDVNLMKRYFGVCIVVKNPLFKQIYVFT